MIDCSSTIEFRFFPRRLSRPWGRSSREGFAIMSAVLVLWVALGQLPQAEANSTPAALARQLGAPRFADRQAAALELERIGSPALPALRAARQSRDMEIKTRAQTLLVKIETGLLTQPTSVRLDFDGATLSEVATSLSSQTGFKIALYPQNLPRGKNQRVTIRHSNGQTFWKALDELCDVASLQYNPGMQGFAGHQDQVFALTEAVIQTLTPISDHGPFRVRLLGIDYSRRLSYLAGGNDMGIVPAPPRPAVRVGQGRARGSQARLIPHTAVQFGAQLVVAAEPRLALAPRGEPRLLEALDDHGNSLIPAGRQSQSGNYRNYFGAPHGPVMETLIPLQRPADPGDTIKTLRGAIPVSVSCRRPGPLIVPLENSVGKTFENSDTELTVHSVRALPDSRQTLVELSIKANGPDSPVSAEPESYSSLFPRGGQEQLQIDVLDTNERLMPWFQSIADAENSRVTLTVTSSLRSAAPKELRYYSVARTDVEIPFEFSGIPMP
jgi:hypothetical protein